MAGDWIKLERSTPNKPEILRLARILGISRDEAFGKAVRFWLWLDEVSTDGHVDGCVDADVDAVVSHIGFARALQEVGWAQLGEDGRFLGTPNFDRHNGETAKKRAEKAVRQRKWRERGASVDAGVDNNVDAPASTGASTREEKRREEKREKVATPNGVACADRQSAPPNGSPSGTGYIFATKSGAWELPARKLAEYEACYQFDVSASLRKAVQWCRDNPAKRKSPGGMAAFLTKWLNREHDRIGTPPANGRPTNEEATARLRQRMERMAMERQQQGAAQ